MRVISMTFAVYIGAAIAIGSSAVASIAVPSHYAAWPAVIVLVLASVSAVTVRIVIGAPLAWGLWATGCAAGAVSITVSAAVHSLSTGLLPLLIVLTVIALSGAGLGLKTALRQYQNSS